MDQEGGGSPLHPESSHILSPRCLADVLKHKASPWTPTALVLTAVDDDAAVSPVFTNDSQRYAFSLSLLDSYDLIHRFVMN